jgi:hypothetical protein
MNMVDTLERPYGYKIRISFDEDPSNPRTDFDNFGTFVLSHKKYRVANETEIDFEQFNNWEAIKKTIIKENGPCIILSVYMYDHSGVALSTVREGVFADQWDSGILGFIFVSHKTIRKEFSLKHVSKKALAKSHEILVSEVEIYGYYLNGNVYDYDILDANSEMIEGASCCGFYGYDHEKSGLIEAAEASIEEHSNQGSNKKPDAEQMELELVY